MSLLAWRHKYSEWTIILVFCLLMFQVASSIEKPVPDGESRATSRLSWQSAFWAIAAIALATMADVPARVCGYPKELTFYLKASPFTCLFDAIYIVYFGLRSLFNHRSMGAFKQAMNEVARKKFHGDSDQPNGPVRIVLLLIGALPQLIKLFSCKGIFVTQAIASCYLASLCMDELMLFMVKGQKSVLPALPTPAGILPTTESIDSSETLHNEARSSALVCTSILISATLSILGCAAMLQRSQSILPVGILVCFCFVGTLSLPWWRFKPRQVSGHVRQEFMCFLRTASAAMAFFMIIFLYKYWQSMTILLITGLAVVGVSDLNMAVDSWNTDQNHDRPVIAYLVLNGLGLLTYYCEYYDAGRTHKPAWTEWLG